MSFYQDNRAGSARWAGLPDIMAAGLCREDGFHLGYFGGHKLGSAKDGPVLVVAGSGAGKLTTCVGWHAINDPGSNLILDIKGEIGAISIGNQARMGKPAYVINPQEMHGLPNNSCNLLSHLHPSSISLHSDIQLAAAALIVASGGGEARFFESQARSIFEAFAKYDVLSRGRTSLPRIKALIDTIQGDLGEWEALARAMIALGQSDVAATVNSIVAMQAEGSRAFGSIIAELNNGLSFLTDPALQASQQEDGDFTLEQALCTRGRPANVYLLVPGELLGIWQPFLRLVIGTAMTLKGRTPSAPRVTFLLDEAAQLGRADFLPRVMTLGRGLGVRPVIILQDIGALRTIYGHDAAQTFQASAESQIWFGIRDLDTANAMSGFLGKQSLRYEDTLQQKRAANAKSQAIQALLNDDARYVAAALNARHHARAEAHQMIQGRALLTSDEALRLPNDHAIVYVAGGGCPPIYVARPTYFSMRCNAGRFHQNPYVGSPDSVQVRGLFGMKTARVIREPVPERFAHLPQYADGWWSYIEGYRS